MNRDVSEHLARRETIAAGLLALFIAALPPDMVWGDSPELAAAAWTLGVPHPTGYSFYLLSMRLFQWLPLGTVAFRSHLFSALCMALACSVLFRFLCDWLHYTDGARRGKHAPAAFCAALAFALTPIAWSQAVITEVYALSALLFALNLRLLLLFWRQPSRYLTPLLLIFSLQLVHHRLSIFLVAASGLVVIARLWIHRTEQPVAFKSILRSIAIGLLPFLFLLYFPLRAMQDPAINWFDPDSWDNFRRYIGGEMYQTILQTGLGNLMQFLSPVLVLRYLYMPLLGYGLLMILIFAGATRSFKQTPAATVLLLLLYLVYQAFVLVYPTGDWQVFLLPSLLLLTIPLAAGYVALLEWLQPRSTVYFYRFAAALCVLSTLLPMMVPNEPHLLLTSWMPQSSRAEIKSRFLSASDWSAAEYASQVWAKTPSGGSIVTGLMIETADNEFFPLLYQQVVEERMPDAPIFGANFTRYDWYRTQVNERYNLTLPMQADENELTTREEWLDEIWRIAVHPLLQRGPVVVPSPQLPRAWFDAARIQNLESPYSTPIVPASYRKFLPQAVVQRLTLRNAETEAQP